MSKDKTISKQLIQKLREETGCGLMECKKALEYGNGDFAIAIAYLKAKGFAVATPGLTFDERVKLFLTKQLNN